MADLKRWFKVWTSILDDPHFQELSLEDIGRWTLLGALLAGVGSRGRLESPAGARRLREVLRIDTVEGLKSMLNTLPNVTVEEGENRHGDFGVTMLRWTKYQEDSTQAARARTSRSKRRGEEIRGDKTRRESESVTPPGIVFEIPNSVQEGLKRCPILGGVAKLHQPRWWQAELRANPGVDLAGELLKAEAWLTTHDKRRSQIRDFARFLHNWLGGAERET